MYAFSILILKGIMMLVNNLCILLKKNINSNKNEAKTKMENPSHSFRKTSLDNHKIKVKL